MLACSFLIKSSSKLLVTRTGIKAHTSLILGRIRRLTLELPALEWRKFYTFELEYLWDQLANLDQILCVASLGVMKGCIMFWGRLDQNSGVHGNRKPPLTYNGENSVSTFAYDPILFILAGNEDMHKISDEFEFRPDRTTVYRVYCPWAYKKFPIDLQWENGVSMLVCSFLIESSSKLLVTRTGIKAWSSSIFGWIRPLILELLAFSHIWTLISLKPVGQSWSNFMCSIIGMGERLHKVWGRLDQNSGFHGNRKPPLTYNGENDFSIFSRLFLIQSFLYLQVMRTCIKSRTSLNVES